MISFENLSFGYEKNKKTIHDVCAQIENGKITMMTGPNGSGKSTILRLLAGTLKLWGGKIQIDGNDVSKMSAIERAKKIAYVPQTQTIPPILVEHLVLAGRFPHSSFFHHYNKKDLEIAKNALARLKIENLSNRALNELSGGQRQKAYLAMALAQESPILLLDEPLSHLDIRQQLEFLSLAKEIAAEGRTILLVIHDLSLALSFADRLLVINDGKIESDDLPEKIAEDGTINRVFGVQTQKKENWVFSL